MTSRGRYTVQASQIQGIISHRENPSEPQKSQYLLRWRSEDSIHPPLSWHGLEDLSGVLHLVQQHVAHHKQRLSQSNRALAPLAVGSVLGQKRKLSTSSHDNHGHQLLTPQSERSPNSRGGSEASFTFAQEAVSASEQTVFNANLRRMEGLIIAEPATGPEVPSLDVRKLPTKDMLDAANKVDLRDAELAIQTRYISRLRKLPGPPVTFCNDIDRETPSLSFKFIADYVLQEGVTKHDLIMGCKKCRPNMGANRGCEYTKKCDCLEFAVPDFEKMDDAQRAEYDALQIDGDPSTLHLPKRFPYHSTGSRAHCLVDFYLRERHPIYECNASCLCGPKCKNRNVQHGRKVPLEIFKTRDNRGFGLRCLTDLRRGQFIDIYLGEVITDEAATAREAASGPGKASYLFSLDKFKGDSVDGINDIKDEDCYVVDGQFMGGPSRFMNHCCQPNVQMHTVSYNKYDFFCYDLAFFACEDVPAGKELTFDYMDADDGSKPDDVMDEDGKTKVPCLCGAEMCRGFLWT
ncbi:SET domain-containing protein [Myriangium duriaei CBS 260.36]|uniref:SET domain-containing protein n=1 Tax=Myriangium duriaei CBS 260.36 TaxID=1168546 RepID=A0A9P4J634_9PEZI|nr:SET domain-containing protein [Myriangium duriaei CBS 260.36]